MVHCCPKPRVGADDDTEVKVDEISEVEDNVDEGNEDEEIREAELELDVEERVPDNEIDEADEVELDVDGIDVAEPLTDELVVADDTIVAPWTLCTCLYAAPTFFFI